MKRAAVALACPVEDEMKWRLAGRSPAGCLHPKLTSRCNAAVAILIIAWAAPVAAQTFTVPHGTPYRIVADHDGTDVERADLRLNGVVVQSKPRAEIAFPVIAFSATGAELPEGAYTVEMVVCTAQNVCSLPATLALTIGPPSTTPPKAPVNIRVEIVP